MTKKTLILTLIGLIFIFTDASTAFSNDLFFKTESQYQNVLVREVIDTDRVILDNDETIALIGIKPLGKPTKKVTAERNEFGFVVEPEVDSPVTPLIDQAFEYVQELLEGQYVRLEFDKQKISDKHQTLAYIFLKDGTLVNTEIIRQGYAHMQISPPNFKYSKEFREAYREARNELRGIQGN